MPVEIQPDSSAQMFNAADIVRWQSFVVEMRLDLPVPPTAIVLLGGQDQRMVRPRRRKGVVAPVGGKPSGHFRVVDLQNKQYTFIVVVANHHGVVLLTQ
jgi:hypothetical protein